MSPTMPWRQMGVYFIVGSTLCVGAAYSLNLKRSHGQLSATVVEHQAQQSEWRADNAHLQARNQNDQAQIARLTAQLAEKNAQYALLDARIDGLEASLRPSSNNDSAPVAQRREAQVEQITQDLLTRHTLLQIIPSGSPMKYQRISSLYGKRTHPISGQRKLHKGIDLVCRIGDPIIAPADGVIETVRSSKKGFGNFLTVRHGFGFMTSYAHLSRFKVRSGEFVRKGEVIATCGNSGYSTGPHLHYEVRFAGRLLNPKTLMDWSIQDFTLPFEKEKKVNWSELAALVEDNVEQMQRISGMANKPAMVSVVSLKQNKQG